MLRLPFRYQRKPMRRCGSCVFASAPSFTWRWWKSFGILALLGNISKLSWILGWEKDQIRQHLRDVQQQRPETWHRFSLDQLGADLRAGDFRLESIPSIPIPGTLSSQRFRRQQWRRIERDDAVWSAWAPGVNAGAQSLVIGKFGNGFRFPGPNANGVITIANHADFDLPANRSFAVEAFVNADPTSDPAPRIVLLKGQINQAGTLTAAGWSLSIVNDRGFSNNIRWIIFDGNQPIETFADLDIADGKFHHLAGVLDRAIQRAQLFVDGEERASIDSSALGALTNAENIRRAQQRRAFIVRRGGRSSLVEGCTHRFSPGFR
jgi:hypothetical protein